MKTVFILVDALKSLYLTEEDMPFLYSLSKEGYFIKQIIPCAGFCERSEIFSGLDGYDTGNFTAIGYLPERSPYKDDGLVLEFFELLKGISSRLYRRLFNHWRKKNKKLLNGYRIPPKTLTKLGLTEDGEKQQIPHREIFHVLDEKGMTYTLDGFTSLSDLGRRSNLTVSELAVREIQKGTDFIPLYIGETDSIGHRFGNDIENIKPTLKSVDNILKEIYQLAAQSEYSFCVMGDHGMVPITKKLDVMGLVQNANCKLHKDYEVFYDSTMVRFWFYNEETKKCIYNLLKEDISEYGFLVDNKNCADYRIPLDVLSEDGKPVYGELVWCANPGVLITPDYFHSEQASENGMHGYIEVVEGHGTGLFVEMYSGIDPRTIENAPSSQICGELCKSLGVEQPNNSKWKRKV